MLFALSLGVLMAIFERAPESVTGGTVRKALSWCGGTGFMDALPTAEIGRSHIAPTSTITSESESVTSASTISESGSSLRGSVVLESLGSGSGEEIGEGIRVLDDELVTSTNHM
jgi:hypothetical protein